MSIKESSSGKMYLKYRAKLKALRFVKGVP